WPLHNYYGQSGPPGNPIQANRLSSPPACPLFLSSSPSSFEGILHFQAKCPIQTTPLPSLHLTMESRCLESQFSAQPISQIRQKCNKIALICCRKNWQSNNQPV